MASPPRLRRVHAIGLLFVANGLSVPPLLPRFPELKDGVGADAAAFGLALLGTGLGGILGSVLAPRIARWLGVRRAAVSSAVVLAGTTLLVATAGSVPALFAAFVAAGVLDGVADTTQNQLLFDAQRRSATSLTSRMHALWSVGALLGTTVGTVALAGGVGVVAQTVGVLAVALALVGTAGFALARPAEAADEEPRPAEVAVAPAEPPVTVPAVTTRPVTAPTGTTGGRVRRTGRRWGLVVVAAMAVAAVEGVANEWSALALRDGLGASATVAGAGPTVVAAAMLLGRVVGDRAIDRWGLEATARLGGAVVGVGCGAGLAAATAWAAPVLLLAGLVAAGLGAAVLFPAMLAAGDRRDASGTGMAVASAAARAGFLTVPVLMGTLSSTVGVAGAFWLLPAAGLVVALALPRALRGATADYL